MRQEIRDLKNKLKHHRDGLFTELYGSTLEDDESRHLFFLRKIIDMAFYDCFSKKFKDRSDAYYWFSLGNDDFLEVCQMAKVDAEKILLTFKAILKKHQLKRRDIIFGKFD